MEQEYNFDNTDIIGRFAQNVSNKNGFIKIRGIANKDMAKPFKTLLLKAIVYIVLTFVSLFGARYINTHDAEYSELMEWIAFLLSVLFFCFLVLFVNSVKKVFYYLRNSVPLSEQMRELINKDIEDGFSCYCYKSAGLYFLKEWIIGTQKELDVISYKEVASYGRSGNDLWIYATNSDYHLFTFKSDAQCEDAYKYMQAKVEEPSIDYLDPVLNTNPRDLSRSREYSWYPKAFKEIACDNLSRWYGRRVLMIFTCVFVFVSSIALFINSTVLSQKNSLGRKILIILIIASAIGFIVSLIRLKKINKSAEAISEDNLSLIKENIHKPDVFFASDYNLYVFDKVILHYGWNLDVIRICDITSISSGTDFDKNDRWPYIRIKYNGRLLEIKSKLIMADNKKSKNLNLENTALVVAKHILSLPDCHADDYLLDSRARARAGLSKAPKKGSGSNKRSKRKKKR